jgi:dethiobiotin synthetase
VLAAAMLAALRARGLDVHALKPVITGLDDPPDPLWPADHVLLARITGSTPAHVAPLGYGPAVSPHLAAELESRPLDPAALRESIRSARRGPGDALIVEGVGGLLVPLGDGYDVRELILDVELPVVIAARPGLGTINHTLLTLEAARELDVRAVVITPWPDAPDVLARSNRDTIARLTDVPVSTLAAVARPDPELLAQAGAALPLDDWLA